MTTTKIPAWLELDTGAHSGMCGVCLEECLALLLGQDKSDHPDRVHPIIRNLAVQANDTEPDAKKRRLLARTLACQVDTDDVSEEVTAALAAFVCRYVAERLPAGERVGKALVAAAECLENPTDETRAEAARAAWAAGAARAALAAEAARAARAAVAALAAEAARAAWAAGAAEAARAAEAAGAAEAAFYADLLTALITEFDRLTGRTTCHKFSKSDWDRVKAALS